MYGSLYDPTGALLLELVRQRQRELRESAERRGRCVRFGRRRRRDAEVTVPFRAAGPDSRRSVTSEVR